MNKKKNKVGVAVCIDSSGNEDLQLCKVYRTLADTKAAGLGCLRVIDDSGEDYLYPENCFVAIQLPQLAEEAFMALA